MTRLLWSWAAVAVLALAVAGCGRQSKAPAAKKPAPAAASKDKRPAATEAESKPTPPAAPETTEPTKPETKPPAPPPPPPAKPGKPGAKPPAVKYERPEIEKMPAEKLGLPIYPEATVVRSQVRTYPRSGRVIREAVLSSEDPPQDIIAWYQGKLGGKAQLERKDYPNDVKRASLRLVDPKTGLTKSVWMTWKEAAGGEPATVNVQLSVFAPPKPAAK